MHAACSCWLLTVNRKGSLLLGMSLSNYPSTPPLVNSERSDPYAIRQRIHTLPGPGHSLECGRTRCLVYVGVFVGLIRASRGIGARRGGWWSRDLSFTGGMGRMTAISEGRTISSP